MENWACSREIEYIGKWSWKRSACRSSCSVTFLSVWDSSTVTVISFLCQKLLNLSPAYISRQSSISSKGFYLFSMKGRGLFGSHRSLPGLSSIPLPHGNSVTLELQLLTITYLPCNQIVRDSKQNTKTIGDLASWWVCAGLWTSCWIILVYQAGSCNIASGSCIYEVF